MIIGKYDHTPVLQDALRRRAFRDTFTALRD